MVVIFADTGNTYRGEISFVDVITPKDDQRHS